MEIIDFSAPEYEVKMFCQVMLNHLVGFLGASKFHATMMNQELDSIQYLNWVKDSVLYTLLSRLEMMVK